MRDKQHRSTYFYERRVQQGSRYCNRKLENWRHNTPKVVSLACGEENLAGVLPRHHFTKHIAAAIGRRFWCFFLISLLLLLLRVPFLLRNTTTLTCAVVLKIHLLRLWVLTAQCQPPDYGFMKGLLKKQRESKEQVRDKALAINN